MYEGDVKNDMRNGHGSCSLQSIGILRYPNGDKYEGEWEDDKKVGQGIAYSIIPQDLLILLMQRSMTVSGQKTTKALKVKSAFKHTGTYKFNNENRYDGEVINDKKNGKGKFIERAQEHSITTMVISMKVIGKMMRRLVQVQVVINCRNLLLC